MSNPVVIHIVRPYVTEDEYIAAESWSIDSKAMFLIGGPSLMPETIVRFDVALATGEKPIRAEAKVIAALPECGDRPAGLKVRFRRFGAATKAFIDRAVDARAASLASHVSIAPPAAKQPAVEEQAPSSTKGTEHSEPPPAEQIQTEQIQTEQIQTESEQTPAQASGEAAEPEATPAVSQEATASTRSEGSISGVHRRPVRSVPAPPNREALLEKLRERGRELRALGKLPTFEQEKKAG